MKELGDASVPFSFDVHVLIYSEGAQPRQRSFQAVGNRAGAFDIPVRADKLPDAAVISGADLTCGPGFRDDVRP